MTGFFLSGLWPVDAQSATAPGAVIAHGMNIAGTSRMTTFARTRPIAQIRSASGRCWPSAAYWADRNDFDGGEASRSVENLSRLKFLSEWSTFNEGFNLRQPGGES